MKKSKKRPKPKPKASRARSRPKPKPKARARAGAAAKPRMKAGPRPVPAGYHSITPYLIVKGANDAIEFYKKAFGAIELFRMGGPGGAVMHAEIKIGDSPVMMADEAPGMGYRAPDSPGGTPGSILIYTPGVDAMFERAVGAGGVVRKPVQDQFYGDRSGTLVDPFGHVWTIATHIEDVAPEEMERRMQAMMQGQPAGA
jgi:PhnB protein